LKGAETCLENRNKRQQSLLLALISGRTLIHLACELEAGFDELPTPTPLTAEDRSQGVLGTRAGSVDYEAATASARINRRLVKRLAFAALATAHCNQTWFRKYLVVVKPSNSPSARPIAQYLRRDRRNRTMISTLTNH
jgi:hypothetical protein